MVVKTFLVKLIFFAVVVTNCCWFAFVLEKVSVCPLRWHFSRHPTYGRDIDLSQPRSVHYYLHFTIYTSLFTLYCLHFTIYTLQCIRVAVCLPVFFPNKTNTNTRVCHFYLLLDVHDVLFELSFVLLYQEGPAGCPQASTRLLDF